MFLHVHDSKDLSENFRIISSHPYDTALSSIFPHYAWVPTEEGAGLASLLASGYPVASGDSESLIHPSFALVHNDRRPGGRILWLSSAALGLLHYRSIDISHHKQDTIKD